MQFIELPYIEGRMLSFRVPEGTHAVVYKPSPPQAVETPDTLVNRALDNPLESLRLEDKVGAGDRVLIICDDMTRPTPTHVLMPYVLDRLNHAGVADRDIQILFAQGTHRPMVENEMRAKVGDEVFQRVACYNHDAFDASQLTYLGKSEDDVEVWLNRRVKEATFVIGVGGLAPHSVVGYGGGAKILYPGVAGAETVLGFHITLSLDPANYHGVYPSPGRTRIRHLADVIGLNFVVNSISGLDGQIYAVYAGSHHAVLERGIRVVKSIYGMPVSRRHRVVVVSSYPKSVEFWQGIGGAYSADTLAQPGAEIILASACPEGGARSYENYTTYVGMNTRDLEGLLRERKCRTLNECLCIAGAIKAAYMREKHHVSLISDGLSRTEIKQMGFDHCETIEAALDAAFAREGQPDEIGVIPYGGYSYCYMDE
jgi:nickel-dependent lactate racemase